MTRRLTALAGAAVLMVGIGVLLRQVDGDPLGPTPVPPTTSTAPDGSLPPLEAPLPEGGAAFSARARSVQTTLFDEVTRRAIRLTGKVRFDAGLVDVRDASGREYTSVHLVGRTRRVQIRSERITLGAGALTITAGNVSIGPHGAATAPIEVKDEATLTGSGLSVEDGGERFALRSPVRVTSFGGWSLNLTGPAVWLGGPTSIDTTGSGFLSWDGRGSIRTAQRRYAGRSMGVHGDLTVRIERTGGEVSVIGYGLHTQIAERGRCALRTRMTIGLTSDARVRGRAGGSTAIDWVPANIGERSACIEEIRGLTPAASWVRVALDPLPAMHGGSRADPVGGRSSGVDDEQRCFVVCSPVPLGPWLAPGSRDARSLTVEVPAGTPAGLHPITLELRGNFAPVRVTVTIRV